MGLVWSSKCWQFQWCRSCVYNIMPKSLFTTLIRRINDLAQLTTNETFKIYRCICLGLIVTWNYILLTLIGILESCIKLRFHTYVVLLWTLIKMVQAGLLATVSLAEMLQQEPFESYIQLFLFKCTGGILLFENQLFYFSIV